MLSKKEHERLCIIRGEGEYEEKSQEQKELCDFFVDRNNKNELK